MPLNGNTSSRQRTRAGRTGLPGHLPHLFSWIVLALAACLSLFSKAEAQAQAFTYRVEISVPRSLLALLEDNLDIYKWRHNPEMNLDFLHRLHERTPGEIRTLLATEGYFSPKISGSLTESEGVWVAHYDVEPGEPVRVGRVDIKFEGDIASGTEEAQAQATALKERWQLRAGSVFRQADWEAAKRTLLRELLIDRYPRARLVDSQATVDPAARSATLSVHADSGPEFFFGDLEIIGLEQYPERIVRNLSPVVPGSPYKQSQLLELQARLQDTRYFSRVDVRVDVDTATPRTVPVRIEVAEAKSERVSLGAGYSTDTGPRGRIEYSNINLREQGWRLNTGLRADNINRTGEAGIEFPVRRDGARDSVSTSFSRRDISNEVTDTARLGVSRAQRIGRIERTLALQYQHEKQEIAGAVGDMRQALVASSSWTIRNVDNLLFPSRGELLNMQLGVAPRSVLSDRSFVRGYIRGVRYHPVGENGTLILRAETGKVEANSRQGIPSDFLFRTGGDQTVRGYGYNSLGVHEGEAIVGGRYLAVMSAEYDIWLSQRWGAAIFYDTGNAMDSLDNLRLVAGYGLGARLRTPVAPVNLDVAYSEEKKGFRIHLSVGFVF